MNERAATLSRRSRPLLIGDCAAAACPHACCAYSVQADVSGPHRYFVNRWRRYSIIFYPVLRKVAGARSSAAVSMHCPSSGLLGDLAVVVQALRLTATDHDGATEAFGSKIRGLLLLILFIGHGQLQI